MSNIRFSAHFFLFVFILILSLSLVLADNSTVPSSGGGGGGSGGGSYIPPSSGGSGGGSSGGGSSSSGSSGGSGSSAGNYNNYPISEADLNNGYSHRLYDGDEITFVFDQKNYYMMASSIYANVAQVNIAELLDSQFIKEDETNYFEINGDDYYDISIVLSNINWTEDELGHSRNFNAIFTIKQIHELVPNGTILPAYSCALKTFTCPDGTKVKNYCSVQGAGCACKQQYEICPTTIRTCEKYYTCPNGVQVQYCFSYHANLSNENSTGIDGASGGVGGSGGCGCKNYTELCNELQNNSQNSPSSSGGSSGGSGGSSNATAPSTGGNGGGQGSGANNLQCNNGCLLENKCVQIGYRTSGTFCNINLTFSNQKLASESCNNDFECSSYVCASSQCVDANLMQKIILWFKSLFGYR